jgi:hypothetical protein
VFRWYGPESLKFGRFGGIASRPEIIAKRGGAGRRFNSSAFRGFSSPICRVCIYGCRMASKSAIAPTSKPDSTVHPQVTMENSQALCRKLLIFSSGSLVKCASKSTASHYSAVLLRCSLAVGLKRFKQAANSTARNDRQSSAAQRHYCSSPWFSIDVGTSIQ